MDPGTSTPLRGRRRREPLLDGRRGAVFTMADQVVSSASNFLLGVLVARAGGADALGTFGVAFLVFLALLGANRALVTEPMTVVGSTEHRHAQLREGMSATLLLSAIAVVLVGLVGGSLRLAGVETVPLLALAAWVPSLLAQDYCRSMAFRLQRPDQALASDVVFAVVQVAGSGLALGFGVRNTTVFIGMWGIGATAGALLGALLLDARPVLRGAWKHMRALWPRSRWFLAEFTTAFPADQGYLLLLPILLGTANFGFYRAGTGLVGPIVVVLVAGGNIGLPASVRRLRQGGFASLQSYARDLTAAVVGVTVAYCGTVAVFAPVALRLVYGPEFVGASTITRLIAMQYVVLALTFGYGQAVKATGKMRLLWASRAVSGAASILVVVLLADKWGLFGAGIAATVAAASYGIGVVVAYLRTRHVLLHASSSEPAPASPVPPGAGPDATALALTESGQQGETGHV